MKARIRATVDGTLRLRDGFEGRTPIFDRADVGRQGNGWAVTLRAGESLGLQFADAPVAPPKPADAAEPLPATGEASKQRTGTGDTAD